MTFMIKKGGGAPCHVAIIMDGNGRWAQRRMLPRVEGHRRGVQSVRRVIEIAAKRGVQYLTLFAFSSENWKRPADEVNALMRLFASALKKEAQAMLEHGVRLRIAGDLTAFSQEIQESIRHSEEMTAHCETMVLTICANYGGRWDIVEAFRKILREDPSIVQHPERVTEGLIDQNLAFDWAPSVDLMIRTGGEQRISNFILWQAAYAELFASPTLWPDFDEKDFDEALNWFAGRQRRFGMTGEQIQALG